MDKKENSKPDKKITDLPKIEEMELINFDFHEPNPAFADIDTETIIEELRARGYYGELSHVDTIKV